MDGRILLILDDVTTGDTIPVYLEDGALHRDSKVIRVRFYARWGENIDRRKKKMRIIEQERWWSLSEEDVWNLLSGEANDLSTDLSGNGINFTGDTIMKCWMICLLFPKGVDADDLMHHWIIKGYIIGFERVLDDGLLWARALLDGLHERRMLFTHKIHYNDKGQVRISFFVAGEATTERISRRHRFLLRSNVRLTQPPEAEEWEDKEMISLSWNEIRSLLHPSSLSFLHPSSLSYDEDGKCTVHPPKCPTLTTLLLDHNPLEMIPETFFEHMKGLQVLDLSSTRISSLPPSLSCLSNLRMLSLNDCPCLESLPMPQIQAKLEILNFKRTPIKSLIPKASFEDMRNLRFLDFYVPNASGITHFSVRGCLSLERLQGLETLVNLHMLDLSGTKIKNLPEEITNLKKLMRLDLIDTKHLEIVNWNEIRRLPKELNWDQCSMNLARESQVKGKNGYFISVHDACIFQTLDSHSPLWEQYFQKFHFYVCAYEERCKDKDDPFMIKQIYYGDIYAQIKTKHFAPSTNYDKCLEIYTSKGILIGIGGVLYNTEFFHLHNNKFITTLSDLEVENLSKIIECRIEKCHEMKSLVIGQSENIDVFHCLKKLWVYHLTKATVLCKGKFGRKSFTLLNSIYLDSCPRLVNLFSSEIRFEKLEILEIRFCYKLETLFYEDQVGQDAFPLLHTLCLWELPMLKTICNGYLPKLEKLKTKGCLKLHKIPLHIGNQNTPPEILGEANWWNNLVWEDMGMKNRIRFREQSPFTLNDQASSGAGEVMKEAVSKSFKTSKATAEDTAKSAAEMAGDTVHKTVEKVKRTVSSPDADPKTEL
ncbi:putative disease resistance protein At1g61300 [Tasmannia lanceolata]|uniref:putative disease resistance protein At1g61300 n=1 Tax=Tasmannia lanceolata TaxID=3420 RepID=UPI004063F5A4